MDRPKVFLSHASEDRDRFVMPLAEGLQAKGIDPWVDAWEILPGDSLVDKIFEEGLKHASAVIIVLSKFSVAKPWVKEELNAAVVGRIAKGTRIIPVVLDDCEVPEALKSTAWLKVDDTSKAIDRIVAAVFERRVKPAPGPPPGYAIAAMLQIPNLNKTDSAVFNWACEYLVDSEKYMVEPAHLLAAESGLDISEVELRDSYDVLEQRHLIKVHHSLGKRLDAFQVTDHGWSVYFDTQVPGFPQIVEAVILAILNDNLRRTSEISGKLKVPHLYVDFIIRQLGAGGHLLVSKSAGRDRFIAEVRGSLRRQISL